MDENIINEVISESIRLSDGAVRVHKRGANRKVEMREGGVFVHMELIIRIGTSISESVGAICDSLVYLIEEQLELPIDVIEVKIAGVQAPASGIQVQGSVLPRDILYEYRNGELKQVRWNEDSEEEQG